MALWDRFPCVGECALRRARSCAMGLALAVGPAAVAHSADGDRGSLPPAVTAALAQARVPADALSVLIADAAGGERVWLAHRARQWVHPASTLKLVTTYAALDTLGPAHVWQTRVYTDGPVVDGTLKGTLYLRGEGDPKLVTEKLWLLLRRVQGLGINHVAGDIVLDRSAYALPPQDPAAFDGEPLRPYNASPDALLINYKSQLIAFTPDVAAGVARLAVEPPLAGVQWPATVPLALRSDALCNDWRAALGLDLVDPSRPRFSGAYPLSCGERLWPLAHPEPERFAVRAVAGLWAVVGGRLGGQVREGGVPAGLLPRLVVASPPLAEVVRDVNKFSNNVMAQHVFLALGRTGGAATDAAGTSAVADPQTYDKARQALADWWRRRMGADVPVPLVDNGSGLSRGERLTAESLARLLQHAYRSGLMPELMASLPVSGHDGTLRRSRVAQGLAHLKTGSLRDVQALAGYVHGPQGERRVFVAIVNHPNAAAARPALEALLEWGLNPALAPALAPR